MLEDKKDLKQFEMWGDQLGKLQKEFASIEKNERQELELYKTSYNRTVKQVGDIIICKDNWDKPNVELNYKVKLDI